MENWAFRNTKKRNLNIGHPPQSKLIIPAKKGSAHTIWRNTSIQISFIKPHHHNMASYPVASYFI